jgi:hypothetical protein
MSGRKKRSGSTLKQKWVKRPKMEEEPNVEDVVHFDDDDLEIKDEFSPKSGVREVLKEISGDGDNKSTDDHQAIEEVDVDINNYLEVQLVVSLFQYCSLFVSKHFHLLQDDISDKPAEPVVITEISQDPATWPQRFSELKINQIISLGAKYFQNKQDCLVELEKVISVQRPQQRTIMENAFHKTLPNGELQEREWVIYSSSSCNIYCLYCKLFSGRTKSNFVKKGFSTFKYLIGALKDHENSQGHKNSARIYFYRVKSGCLATVLSKVSFIMIFIF